MAKWRSEDQCYRPCLMSVPGRDFSTFQQSSSHILIYPQVFFSRIRHIFTLFSVCYTTVSPLQAAATAAIINPNPSYGTSPVNNTLVYVKANIPPVTTATTSPPSPSPPPAAIPNKTLQTFQDHVKLGQTDFLPF